MRAHCQCPDTAIVAIDIRILEVAYRDRRFTLNERLQIGLALAECAISIREAMSLFDISRSYAFELRGWAPRYKLALDYVNRQAQWAAMSEEEKRMFAYLGPPRSPVPETPVASTTPPVATLESSEIDSVSVDGIAAQLEAAFQPLNDANGPMADSIDTLSTIATQLLEAAEAGDGAAMYNIVSELPDIILSLTSSAMTIATAFETLGIPDALAPIGYAISPLGDIAGTLFQGVIVLTQVVTGVQALANLSIDALERLEPQIDAMLAEAEAQAVESLQSFASVADAVQDMAQAMESATCIGPQAVAPAPTPITEPTVRTAPQTVASSLTPITEPTACTAPQTTASNAPRLLECLPDTAPLEADVISYGKLKRQPHGVVILVVDQDCIRKAVVSLAMDCKASEQDIREHIREIYHVSIAESDIWRIIDHYSEKAMEVNHSFDLQILPLVKAAAFDEIYFGKYPTCSGICLWSHYTITLSSKKNRQEETWEREFEELKSMGFNPDTILADDCGSLASAAKASFGKPPQSDVFHLKKGLGSAVEQNTKKVYSMLNEQWKFESSTRNHRDKTIADWFAKEDQLV